MSRVREFLSRPLREQSSGVLVALAAAVLIAAALPIVPSLGGERSHRPTHGVPSAPSPVLNPSSPQAQTPVLSAAEAARARATARSFLSGYVLFLYGRGRAQQITAVTSSVRAGLRAHRSRVTPAQRHRRPRVLSLVVVGQTLDTAIATARIDDGGVTPYALTFTLEHHADRWVVSDLAND